MMPAEHPLATALAALDTAAQTAAKRLSREMARGLRIPYALRRVPRERLACVLRCPDAPQAGALALACLEKLGRNARLECPDGRRCDLHEGDLLAVVFGNRYATQQYEGYARADGDRCHLLAMAGVCGWVESRHARIAAPTELRLLGALADAEGRPLHLCDFALPPRAAAGQPRVVAVCGTSMDVGKTYTAMSLIVGLRRQGHRVAAMKLTGTACGRDTWAMLDAGACPAVDLVDGGYPSTYLCTLEELLDLYGLLTAHATAEGAEWLVIEIADGILQRETAALLQCPTFTATVDAWVLAANDPLGALGAVGVLRGWGIEAVAISGVLSMSPLGMQEAQAATGVQCLTAEALQQGALVTHRKEDGALPAVIPPGSHQPKTGMHANGRGQRELEAEA
jgi:hypothetical protein